jgi:hypothetical protein
VFEKAVLDYYNQHDAELIAALESNVWPPTDERYHRPRAGAPQDRGDIVPLPYVLSLKNWGSMEPSGWVNALDKMMAAAKLETGIVVAKRRGKGTGGAYVFTTLDRFMPFHDAYLMAELSA